MSGESTVDKGEKVTERVSEVGDAATAAWSGLSAEALKAEASVWTCTAACGRHGRERWSG